MFDGTWVDLGTSQYLISQGLQGVTFCDSDSCSFTTFSISQAASNIPTGRAGSYTYWSVKLQQGPITEYRNIICQGGGKCNPLSGQSPDPGWVLTLDTALSFVPINGRTKYWIYKGNYQSVWPLYYFSSALGGGGIGTDLLTYNVYDSPGEAGTQLNQNINSEQYLDTGPSDQYPTDWNEPILQGRIIVTPINVPLAFPYNVTLPKGLNPAVIEINVILDASDDGFNLTVNGPQQIDLADQNSGSSAGNRSGEMYQVIEIDCGLVAKGANCSEIPSAMYFPSSGSDSQGNVTWCDESSYVKSVSLMQTLMSLDNNFFRFGFISKLCTKNQNGTEIYNVTAYNFSCLPPCIGTMYTYEEVAVGCLLNCTLKALGVDKKCENTYGLYSDEFVCNGGFYHGQQCMSPEDQGTCFDIAYPTQVGVCTSRDNMPGISGPNLKNLPGFNRSDPGLMVHGIYYGDLHFVDWLRRGPQVAWNEVAVDVAAGLGFFEVLQYLIQNGCPWRNSAITAATSRGWTLIVQYLTALKPPNGIVDPTCGCSRFYLHPVDLSIPRCFPLSSLDCYPTCSIDPDTDSSCQNGHSNYIWENETITQCSTGSRTALVRGPQIFFLSNSLQYNLRAWAGTSIGFSKRVIICTQHRDGVPPVDICGNVTLVKYGSTIDFYNYHVSDRKLRVFYFAPTNSTPGRIAKFNFSVSRMTQSPTEDLTGINGKSGLLYSTPIAARFGFLEIHVSAINYRPMPLPPVATYYLPEDRISVLTLRFHDIDTAPRNIRAYVTEFPIHGDLHQIYRVNQILNSSFSSNLSYGFGKQLSCQTESTDCRANGNCNNPLQSCYYVAENFIIGDAIAKNETLLRQLPDIILNLTSASIVDIHDSRMDGPCILTDRYAEDDWWAGEDFCDFASQDNVYGSCRRCMTANGYVSPMPGGHWSGRIILPPTYLQRHNRARAIDAPNDQDQGGVCSLNALCSVNGNTASKSACIDWFSLDANGQPSLNKRKAWLMLNPSFFINGPPCNGANGISNCSRNVTFLWPPGYEPHSKNRDQFLTKYGDPVDEHSFYRACGDHGVHQFQAQYTQQVFMTGFDLHSSMPGSIFFRVLARTGRRWLQNTFDIKEITNITQISTRYENFTFIETRISHTNRKECNKSTEFCGGEEWREVWRGHASDGRNSSAWSRSVLLGPDEKDSAMEFRFAPVNFTTSELILEACGLMYEGPTNNDGGNPLESLEGLVLVGTMDYPQGLVSSEDLRIAYIPHPHFAGKDSFSFRGEDFQNVCDGYECAVRADLQEGLANLIVENTNDRPLAEEIEIVSDSDQELVFTVNGIDASPDSTFGWSEWGILGQGAGAASRLGVGPSSFHYYELFQPDPLGSYDEEPDYLLISTITRPPDRGTLTQLGTRTYRYAPPAGAGGRPFTDIGYTLSDNKGMSSNESIITINVLCGPGFFIDQSLRLCVACPSGFYKAFRNDAMSCSMCGSGMFALLPGSTTCEKCSIGTFAAEPASISCKACRPGTFANSSGMKMCRSCPSGSYAPRPFATMCLNCGILSYAPIPGSSRCYDCPYLSWSNKLASTSVQNCMCIHNSFRQSIFDSNVSQRWSTDGLGSGNGSFVAPGVEAIAYPWPLRLNQISSNCTQCPEGAFCYGEDLFPVSKIGYWTDWSNSGDGFWPDKISPRFYECKARNIRGVCLGYPSFDQQEQIEVCKYRKNFRACPSWPKFNYTNLADPARCKAGYDGVICSECASFTLQQCVPKNSDSDDGWLSWQSFENYRAAEESSGIFVPDCYSVGGCYTDTNSSTCLEKKDLCNAYNATCRWDVNIYYRNYAGFCLPCPLGLAEGFLVYLVWFATYGLAVALLVFFYLTDMKTCSIAISFFQTAALIGQFQLAWPSVALSFLQVYSVANVNLEALPWKCFFDVSPSYREFWYLTIFVPAGLIAGTIVWWMLPFFVVPHRGKIAFKAFKQIMERRDNMKETTPLDSPKDGNSLSHSSKEKSKDDSNRLAVNNFECHTSSLVMEPSTSTRVPISNRNLALQVSISPESSSILVERTHSRSHDRDFSLDTLRPKSSDGVIIEEVYADSDVVSAVNFGVAQVKERRLSYDSPNLATKTMTLKAPIFDRFGSSKAKIFKSPRRNKTRGERRNVISDLHLNGMDDECVLPGSVTNYEELSVRQSSEINGVSFGSTTTDKRSSDAGRKSKLGYLFNRGRAAIATIEGEIRREQNDRDSSSETTELIPNPPDTKEKAESTSCEMNLGLVTSNTKVESEKSTRNQCRADAKLLTPDAKLLTPSQEIRKEDGYREWSTQNITQSFVPKMEERLDTARSTASSDDVYKPVGLPWYARKQYIDLAWRNCVGVLDMMFIMAASKTLEVSKY